MVDLTQWRTAIGRFHVASVAKFLSDRFRTLTKHEGDKSDSDSASVGDVFFTWICLLFLASIVVSLKHAVIHAVNEPFLLISLLSVNKTLVADPSLDIMLSSNFECVSQVSTVLPFVVHSVPVIGVGLYALFAFASRRVLLSGDVEQNPGPVDTDKTGDVQVSSVSQNDNVALSDSIKHLEDSLQQKLDMILNTINVQSGILKQQEETLKRQGELLKQQGESLTKFGEEQNALKDTVTGLCSEVKEVKNSVQTNERAIGGLAEKQDRLNKTVSDLESEIDRLEGFSRRNNVKVFGIPEASPGEKEDCAEAVTNVLNTYIPEITWDTDVVERAHRLGRPNSSNPNPRPIIAKFQSWRDAMRVMKDREARRDMENDGLRLAQDLTKRQSAKLKSLRAEGRVGYYVNGKLRIKDQQDVRPTDQRGRQMNNRHDDENDDRHGDQNYTMSQRSPTRSASPGLFTEATVSPHPSRPIRGPGINDYVISSQGQGSDIGYEMRNPLLSANDRPRTRSVSARGGGRQSTLNWNKNSATARGGRRGGGVQSGPKK